MHSRFVNPFFEIMKVFCGKIGKYSPFISSKSTISCCVSFDRLRCFGLLRCAAERRFELSRRDAASLRRKLPIFNGTHAIGQRWHPAPRFLNDPISVLSKWPWRKAVAWGKSPVCLPAYRKSAQAWTKHRTTRSCWWDQPPQDRDRCC